MRLTRSWQAGVLFACIIVRHAIAADSAVMLDEVVVSAPGPARMLRQLPYGVAVITAADIERSTATTLGDMLSREANVNLQSYFGGTRYSGIDIRGMGESASSNVLILVDGIKLNENDLSGADLGTIPLAQIERIEIVRGAGGVRYGNGAVAGVVNIITRSGRPNHRDIDLFAKVGAYGTSEARVAGSVGSRTATASFNLSRLDTDGYRVNGGEQATDGAFEFQFMPSGDFSFLEVFVKAARHRSETGMPGPVSAAAMAAGESARRATTAPFDRSSVADERYTIGLRGDFGRAGQAEVLISHRDRENPFIIGFNPLLSVVSQQARTSSDRRDVHAKYDLPLRFFGRDHTVTIGHERQTADYLRAEGGTEVLDTSTRRFGDAESRSSYFATTIDLPHALIINAGARTSRFDTQARDLRYNRAECETAFETVLVTIAPGVQVPIQVPRLTNCVDAYRLQKSQGGQWRNRAAELGLTWQPSRRLTLFGGMSRHFRNPNVDELLLAAADLRPQTGDTYQVGTRVVTATGIELAATLFRMRIRDEIYYGLDPLTGSGVNRNFERPTRRTGFEFEGRWRYSDRVGIRGNVGYVDATFEGMNAFVPLVPRLSANAQVEYAPRSDLRGTLAVRYVDERLDGNDFTNVQYRRLPAYTVWDAAMRFDVTKAATIAAGVNNLFDKVYSTLGYSETYYPMPGRHAYASLRLKF